MQRLPVVLVWKQLLRRDGHHATHILVQLEALLHFSEAILRHLLADFLKVDEVQRIRLSDSLRYQLTVGHLVVGTTLDQPRHTILELPDFGSDVASIGTIVLCFAEAQITSWKLYSSLLKHALFGVLSFHPAAESRQGIMAHPLVLLNALLEAHLLMLCFKSLHIVLLYLLSELDWVVFFPVVFRVVVILIKKVNIVKLHVALLHDPVYDVVDVLFVVHVLL